MAIKLIFVDIDGTFFDHHLNHFPPSAVNALRRAQQGGAKIIFASGRSLELMEQIGATQVIQADGFITVNGSLIYNANKELIRSFTIPDVIVKDYIHQALKNEWTLHLVEEVDQYYINPINESCRRAMVKLHIEVTPPMHSYSGNPVYTMMLFAPKTILDGFELKYPQLHYHRFEDDATDVNPQGVSKGAAAQFMMDYLQINRADAMAFGDGHNDIEMLQAVGIGVAMGNAIPDLKKVATYVTDDISHDGLAKALNHFKIGQIKTR